MPDEVPKVYPDRPILFPICQSLSQYLKERGVAHDADGFDTEFDEAIKRIRPNAGPNEKENYKNTVRGMLERSGLSLEQYNERMRARHPEAFAEADVERAAINSPVRWQEFPTDPHHPANLTPPIEVYNERPDNPQLGLPGVEPGQPGGQQRRPRLR